MKEKLAADAAIAECEARMNKDECEDDEDEDGSINEHKSRTRRRSSDLSSLNQLDAKMELIAKSLSSRTRSLDDDRPEKIKKQMSVDSSNDASSEDSNDSNFQRIFSSNLDFLGISL